MIRDIKEWLEKRKKERDIKLWNEGFDWAAGELLRYQDPEFLEMWVDAEDTFGLKTKFDEGVLEAVNRWRKIIS